MCDAKKKMSLGGNLFNQTKDANLKLYQIIIFILIISFIPLVNILNKVIVGIFLSSIILYFNIKTLDNTNSKSKVFLNSFIANLTYYLFATFQTFLTYINLINNIKANMHSTTIDISFILISIKLILFWIPLAVSSLICFKNHQKYNKIIKLFVIINTIIFIFFTT